MSAISNLNSIFDWNPVLSEDSNDDIWSQSNDKKKDRKHPNRDGGEGVLINQISGIVQRYPGHDGAVKICRSGEFCCDASWQSRKYSMKNNERASKLSEIET